MENSIAMTNAETCGERIFKSGKSVAAAAVTPTNTRRFDKTPRKSATRHPLANHLRSWHALCAKARFFGLQEQDLNLLLQVGQVMHTHDGQQVFCEGESNDTIYLILDGKVKLGKNARKPIWVNMGPYGMINMSEDDEPIWNEFHICSSGNCLEEGVTLTKEACHSLTAVSDGESNLLAVDAGQLEKQLNQQGGSQRYAQIIRGLRQMVSR